MTTHVMGRLRTMHANLKTNLLQSADAITGFWRRWPSGPGDEAGDVVLGIFAGAAGVSIATALALIATVPR